MGAAAAAETDEGEMSHVAAALAPAFAVAFEVSAAAAGGLDSPFARESR